MSGGGDFVQRGENDIVKIEINVLNLKLINNTRPVAHLALAIRRSNHSAKSHPQS